jgi:hypothetical protein
MVPVQDLAATVVASVALVATIFLSFLGLYITFKFSGAETRIRMLEEKIKGDKSDLHGLRVISSIILRFVNDSYALTDIERRQIENVIEKINESTSAIVPIDATPFVNAMEMHMSDFPRVALYAKLLSPAGGGEAAETLRDVSTRFPDLETLAYLEALSQLVSEAERQEFRKVATVLRRKLLPYYYDSSLWTG